MKVAGHYYTHSELLPSSQVLWETTHEHQSMGHPPLTYMEVMVQDAGKELYRTGKRLKTNDF